ncbi:MAG: hypothetical protein ACI30J_04480 [Paludibacteraceae bacterium]
MKSSESSTLSVSPTSTVYASQNGTWSAEIGGTDTVNFHLNSVGTDGKCSVTFDPKSKDVAYEATLTLTCTYKDALGAGITYYQTIALTGTGYTPEETLLSLKNTAGNPGDFVAEDPLSGGSTYRYPDQLGTAIKTALFDVSYQYLSDPTFTWTSNENNVFALEQGTPILGENSKTYTLPITIKAGVSEAVASTTTYNGKLTISGTSTLDATTFTQTLDVSVTISPKKANTLKWGLEKIGTSYYVLYTDQANQPAFKDRNSPAPIVFSSTYATLGNYVTIDTAACTFSPKAEMTTSRNIHAVQAESDEYEGIVLDTVMQVKKHNLAFTYPQVDPTRGNGTRLYRNTRYDKILSTNSIDAGEVTGFSEFKYYESADDGKYGQTLIDNGDGTYGMQTGDLVTPTPYLRFIANINATTNYYGRNSQNSAVTFLIIRDPIHVPTGPGSLSKFTSGAHTGEYYGLWLNNAYDMYGSTFKVSENKATWIGYDWVKNASGVYEWTGTNTDKTDWTTVSGQGSTNAFALENGGSVVFHFRGVPMYTYFAMYFQTATSDGTVTVEESADGSTWTATANESTSATYLSAAGGKYVHMKGNSRYIRFSYSGSNHVVIAGTTIYENNFIRTDFTALSRTKELVDAGYHELRKNSDGTWGTFDFTLKVANWGKNGIQYTIDNPDFELVIDDEGYLAANTGLDEYKEFPAHIQYKGSEPTARATIKLFTRDFYSKTAADTLRSLTFTVNAIGIGTDMPQTITNATKTTTYMTGTVGPYLNTATQLEESNSLYSQTRGNNPHTGLSENDFSACFGTDGNPLFDKLYIFGVTTNSDNTTYTYTYYYQGEDGSVQSAKGTFPKISAAGAAAPCNAITPCYVYTKNGSQYDLTQTISNMNVADKPIGTITASGQKIYFSGFCPSISTGYQASDMGAIHVTGGKSATIDIYLDNCQLRSRVKKRTGLSGHSDTIKYTDTSSGVYIEGSGAIMVFGSSSTDANAPFSPNIHLRGENVFRCETGNLIWVRLFFQDAYATQSSAPIHLYTSSASIQTTLTIDDIWPTTSSTSKHVNGGLKLRKVTNQSPSIDLGNDKSKIYFNGGRINLHNAWPGSSNYVTTFAISCRKYVKTVGTLSVSIYGMGGDYDVEDNGGEVHFNDGTISVLPMDLSSDATYAAYYRDGISIKCPSKTYVDGGTYISSIWACTDPTSTGASPTNQWGDAVVSHMLSVTSVDGETGLATVDFPSSLKNEDEEDTYFGETLKDYYARKGIDYGRASLAPNDTNYVQLMLPAKYTGKEAAQEETVYPWAFFSTAINVGNRSATQTIGGDNEVHSSDTEKTNFLIWTKIDQYIRNAALDDSYRTPAIEGGNGVNSIEAQVKSIGTNNYANVTNTEDYQIGQKLYYMFPVQADTWQSFMAPFDVSNIYVFDTYPYSELQKKDRATALSLQGDANMDLAYFIAAPIVGIGNATQDLNTFVTTFLRYGYGQDTTSGVYPKSANTKTVNGVATSYYPTNYTSAKGYTTDYRGQNALTAYDGTNANAAHYYLYHSKDKLWAFDGKDFVTDWEYVTPVNKMIGETERSVLMQQGEIYALQFPYCPGCGNVAERTTFDYWTGKFILLEGYGPQTVRGKNAQSEQLTAFTTDNYGQLRGNMTLAEMQVPNYSGATGYLNNVFFQTDGKNIFEPNDTQADGLTIPGGVFILANPNTRNSAKKIAAINVFSGEVTYSDEENATGLQTLARDHTLLVATAEQQLIITALVPQQVAVYTASGQLIAQQYLDGELRLDLPQGMYLVRGAKDEAKAVVR